MIGGGGGVLWSERVKRLEVGSYLLFVLRLP